MTKAQAHLHPFLKWAGGKRQILNKLMDMRPKQFNIYYEPFVGGGALFWKLAPSTAVISDINAELINAYQMVRDHVEELLVLLEEHHRKHNKEHYYCVRGLGSNIVARLTPLERAARMIYLNKTAYNGLWRVNRRGEMNVPIGRYKNPKIYDPENLRACSTVLRQNQVKIVCEDYGNVIDAARPGDWVYLDPPYFPVSATADFTSYTPDGFEKQEQERLASVCRDLDRRGVMFMASNADVSPVHGLYAGFRIEHIKVGRAISCNGRKRGEKAGEVIITNYN